MDAEQCDNPRLLNAVEAVTDQLIKGVDPDRLPVTVHVLEDPQVNAFALPGGELFILSGLLSKVESAEELAGVLGHEIGHAVHRHGMTRIARAVWWRLLLAILVDGGGSVGDLVVSGGLGLTELGFDREDESESDVYALELMLKVGMDPTRFPDFFTRLPGGSIPDWFLTHPEPESRAEALREMIDARRPLDITWGGPSIEDLRAPCMKRHELDDAR